MSREISISPVTVQRRLRTALTSLACKLDDSQSMDEDSAFWEESALNLRLEEAGRSIEGGKLVSATSVQVVT